MITTSRAIASAAALAAALLIVGCAGSSGDQTPTSSPSPDTSTHTDAPILGDDVEAAWLDEGRMFAILTWGSSTCVPVVDEVSAEGQTVTVSLVDAPSSDGTERACTMDLAPRASVGAIPEGVDPTRDVEFIVTAGADTDDVDLDGNATLTGTPGDATDYEPSAGWFDDDGIVLLTWGSSGCLPIVEGVDVQGGGATVTFATEDRACTMDMAPRATIIGLDDNDDHDDVDDDRDENEFVLTLVGDNLDGTVTVRRG
ncbi:hypothetical protein [Microbacterium sp.]|uniref:hypothetical protein n=1 Tax=Microbacterium sp. TaxID=51671 RepID=UPI003F977024